MPTQRLLVIEDSSEIASLVKRVGEELGCDVLVATTGAEAQAAIRDFKPGMVLLDLVIPGTDGIELLHFLKANHSQAAVVLMSGRDSRVVDVAARLGRTLNLKVLGSLAKPFVPEDVERHIRSGLRIGPALTAADLARALKEDEIVVHYQPKVSAGEGVNASISAEVLVRWNHPEHGTLGPNHILPLAASAGLVPELTLRTFDLAVENIARWSSSPVPVTLAVNLSPTLIYDESLPDRLAERAANAGVDCSAITLELTEDAAVENFERAMTVSSRFRLKGFGLSIDDFGTGHSSLMQLVRMPFNELKIDQSFVAEIGRSQDVEAVITASVLLAKHLGMTVCGEGVETAEARQFLKNAGADTIQGYLIAKPLPFEQWHHWVSARQLAPIG